MIHHLSISARDPRHVAEVLAELFGWQMRRFPTPGSYVVAAEDEHGTFIEIHPDGTVLLPGEGEDQAGGRREASPTHFPFHIFLSVDTDRETVRRIGEREGWRTLDCWRLGGVELIEFWVENRLMIEIATPDMMLNYPKTARADFFEEATALRARTANPA